MIGKTQMPLPYAQISRFVVFLFLVVIPWAVVRDVKWLSIPLTFLISLIFNTIDFVAAEMEAPFGKDDDDVDMEKAVRRIDKHTAAIVGMWMKRPAPHFDVFPEAKNTYRQNDSIYRLAAKRELTKQGSTFSTNLADTANNAEESTEAVVALAQKGAERLYSVMGVAATPLQILVSTGLQTRAPTSASLPVVMEQTVHASHVQPVIKSRDTANRHAEEVLVAGLDIEEGGQDGGEMPAGEAPDDDYVESEDDDE